MLFIQFEYFIISGNTSYSEFSISIFKKTAFGLAVSYSDILENISSTVINKSCVDLSRPFLKKKFFLFPVKKNLNTKAVFKYRKGYNTRFNAPVLFVGSAGFD